MKDAFDALDENERRTNLTQMGTIFARAQAGDLPGAIAVVRQRVEADRAAGQDTTEDEQILAGLESADPVQQRAAIGTVGIMLAAVEPDKFGETYGKLNPSENKTTLEREYEFNVRTFGKDYADQVVASKNTDRIAVQPGGSVFEAGPQLPTAQGGGDPVSSGGGAPAGAPSLTVEQFRANVDAIGPERASRLTTNNGIPVVVRSVQEANSLPPGTLYATPTGERYTR